MLSQVNQAEIEPLQPRAIIICVIGRLPQSTNFWPSPIDPVKGGPGAGKGTMCARLATDLNLVHLSVGDLLRAEAEKPPLPSTADIKALMKDGKLLSTEYVQHIIETYICQSQSRGYHRFLVDGFPRSVEQALLFEKRVSLVGPIASPWPDMQ